MFLKILIASAYTKSDSKAISIFLSICSRSSLLSGTKICINFYCRYDKLWPILCLNTAPFISVAVGQKLRRSGGRLVPLLRVSRGWPCPPFWGLWDSFQAHSGGQQNSFHWGCRAKSLRSLVPRELHSAQGHMHSSSPWASSNSRLSCSHTFSHFRCLTSATSFWLFCFLLSRTDVVTWSVGGLLLLRSPVQWPEFHLQGPLTAAEIHLDSI